VPMTLISFIVARPPAEGRRDDVHVDDGVDLGPRDHLRDDRVADVGAHELGVPDVVRRGHDVDADDVADAGCLGQRRAKLPPRYRDTPVTRTTSAISTPQATVQHRCGRVRRSYATTPPWRTAVEASERCYFLLRRWWRVLRSSLRCFFLAMRLRRFLMTEPMHPHTSTAQGTGHRRQGASRRLVSPRRTRGSTSRRSPHRRPGSWGTRRPLGAWRRAQVRWSGRTRELLLAPRPGAVPGPRGATEIVVTRAARLDRH
jgi:hypothetical protein